MRADEFLILSLKHSEAGMPLTWWKPEGRGYTRYIDEAGRYTREECMADHCLHGHPLNQAVRVEIVIPRTMPVAPAVRGTTMRRPGAHVVHSRHLRFMKRVGLTREVV